MIATIQIVSNAKVEVAGKIISQIKDGVLIFLCIEKNDNESKLLDMYKRISDLKIFKHKNKKAPLSIKESNSEVLIVSQFTLAAVFKANKPSFHKAANYTEAKVLYDKFVRLFNSSSILVKEGVFGEHMNISLTNKGPYTLNITVK